MIYDIDKVFKNFPSDDIQDRLNCIMDTMCELEDLQFAIQEKGHWCPACNRWYYKTDCTAQTEEKTKTVCTNPLMGYLDDYEYEEETYWELFYVCPKGHEVKHPRMFGGFRL